MAWYSTAAPLSDRLLEDAPHLNGSNPGAIIYCGFTGVVQEVAAGDETIMVKVESPKRLAFGHTLEWLPFEAKVMKPATPKKLQAEIQQYRVLLETRLKTYDNALADLMRG